MMKMVTMTIQDYNDDDSDADDDDYDDVMVVSMQDLHTIYCHLYHMDVLSHLREHQLRSVVLLCVCV